MMQWVNDEQTVLVRAFDSFLTLEVAVRDQAGDTWGPPILVHLEPEQSADIGGTL